MSEMENKKKHNAKIVDDLIAEANRLQRRKRPLADHVLVSDNVIAAFAEANGVTISEATILLSNYLMA